MYTDSIEQLRGTAGARPIKVRDETALGDIHHAKQWRLDHVRQIPELRAGDGVVHKFGILCTRYNQS